MYCERCNYADWYPLDSLKELFSCNRCAHTQLFMSFHSKGFPEPEIYYQLDEVFYQFANSGSDIVISLANELKSKSQQAFHYLMEIEVYNSTKQKLQEVDLVAILDGKVIFAECKKTFSSFDKELKDQILRYNNLLSKLPIKKFVIGCSEKNIADSIKKNIRDHLPHGILVEFITELFSIKNPPAAVT